MSKGNIDIPFCTCDLNLPFYILLKNEKSEKRPNKERKQENPKKKKIEQKKIIMK